MIKLKGLILTFYNHLEGHNISGLDLVCPMSDIGGTAGLNLASLDTVQQQQQGVEVKPSSLLPMTTLILAGLGLTAIGLTGRYAIRAGKKFSQTIGSTSFIPDGAFSKYYKGGFDPKMTKREASLILGVSPSASKIKVKEAHKRIMLLNHPDRGGSPYLAAKINEAKDYMK